MRYRMTQSLGVPVSDEWVDDDDEADVGNEANERKDHTDDDE